MKKIIALSISFCILIVLYANGINENESSISESEQRIITLAPNLTEIVYALDSQNNLVGVSEACNFPSNCKNKTNVGNPWKPNIEMIIALRPTVVIVSSITDPESIASMQRAGINVKRVSYEDNLEGAYKTIIEVGKLIGKENEGINAAEFTKSQIESVKTKTSGITKKKTALYLMSWGELGDYAATKNTFIDDALKCAGLINIAADSEYWKISRELLLKSDPNIIFVPDYAEKESGILNLTDKEPYCLLNSQIFIIDGDAIERQGIRIGYMVQMIAKLAYPELF